MKWIALLVAMKTLSSWAGIYAHNKLWPSHEITTCFAREDKLKRGSLSFKSNKWQPLDKEKVKQWILSEYSQERTGVHFVGFEDCDESSPSDVVIFYNKTSKLRTFFGGNMDGLALLGETEDSVIGYPHARGYVAISTSGMDKGTVVHEFGHVAGLEHENDHPDAFKLQPECPAVKKNVEISDNRTYESYDRDSVMNYCKIHARDGDSAGLSAGDVKLLKRIYP